jgi:hypothetical protein
VSSLKNTQVKDERDDRGVKVITLPTWRDVITYLSDDHADTHGIIWRGQSDAKWTLTPSLKRCLNPSELLSKLDSTAAKHQGSFRDLCTSTKRELYDSLVRSMGPCKITDSDEQLWAFAQHHGASTPLLDWTRSPQVALFFALADHVLGIPPHSPKFEESVQSASNSNITDDEDMVALWGLFPGVFETILEEQKAELPTGTRSPKCSCEFSIIESVEPENKRAVSQQGLFTFFGSNHRSFGCQLHPNLAEIDVMLRKAKNLADRRSYPALQKLLIPKRIAPTALTSLGRSNICYATLFPDEIGACMQAALGARLPNYAGHIPELVRPVEDLGESRDLYHSRRSRVANSQRKQGTRRIRI